MGRKKIICRLSRLIALGICLLPSVVCAEGRIEAFLEVIDPANPGAKILLTLKNTGDLPVTFMQWETPFPEFGGRLGRSLFKVADESGNEIAYRGSWAYLGRLTMDSFRSIAPGEILSKEVDIASEYEFEPHHFYTIEYELNLTHEPDPDVVPSAERSFFVKPTQKNAVANPVTVFFGDDVRGH